LIGAVSKLFNLKLKTMRVKKLIILCLSALFMTCSHRGKEPSGTNPKEIKRNDVHIDYHLTGKGDTTLLFVHGAFIDQSYWQKQVDYFSSHYLVVTMDLPGHGKSGRERKKWTMQGFADDVSEVISELNLKNVILIGHSMAGDINLITASQQLSPIIGFIGIDNFKNAATPFPEKYKPIMDSIQKSLRIDFENTNERYARMALVTQETPMEVTNRVVSDFRNAYKPMALDVMDKFFDVYETEMELLPKMRYKLYLVNVDYFPTNEEPLKKYTGSGYEIIYIKGTSHYPMIETPELLNGAIQKAIDKIGEA
jgi:pimeloyl-ACP methyl ester carboxylesterase